MSPVPKQSMYHKFICVRHLFILIVTTNIIKLPLSAHEAVVTVAIFSPNPSLILDRKRRRRRDSYADFSPSSPSSSLRRRKTLGEVVVSADFNGCIRVFKNRMDGAS